MSEANESDGPNGLPETILPDLKLGSRVSGWLESKGKLVGVPVLILSFLSLCVGIANYRLQTAGNRPLLVSTGLTAKHQTPASLHIGWNNVGKTTARRGNATLLAIRQQGASPERIASAPIVGAGTNVFAGYGSSATFSPAAIDLPAFYLACIGYFDDEGTEYEQAFLFEKSPKPDEYEEVAPPAIKICG